MPGTGPSDGAAPSAPADWDALRERLARAAETVGQVGARRARSEAEILEARARALATSRTAGEPEALVELLTFRWGTERWAVEASWALRALPMTTVTRVPTAPAVVAGIVRHEGEILPLYELRRALGLPVPPGPPNGHLVVLGEVRPELAFVVDAVEGVEDVPARHLEGLAAVAAGGEREWVRGLTTGGLILLEAAHVLGDPRLFAGGRTGGAPDARRRGRGRG